MNMNKYLEQNQQQISTNTTNKSNLLTINQKDFNYCDIIGCFMKGFIIVTFNGYLYLIDQHAVSQKYLYQKSMDILHPKNIIKCSYEVNVPNLFQEIFINDRYSIQREGWQYQIINKYSFYTNIIIVQAPELYGVMLNDEDFIFLIQNLYHHHHYYQQDKKQQYSEHEKYIIATHACHNAYRIGDILHLQEMRNLTNIMSELKASFNCPHTRPTIITIGSIQSKQQEIHYYHEYHL